jgi:hypothetical protein
MENPTERGNQFGHKNALLILLVHVELLNFLLPILSGVVIALTVPALLEKSEEHIVRSFKKASIYVQACGRACKEYKCNMTNMISETKKLR